MKKLRPAFIILVLFICALNLAACGKDSNDSQLEQQTKAAKTEFGKMVEDSKRAAAELEAKAKEQAQEAMNAAEDAMVEASEQIDEVKEDIKGAIE